MTVRIGVAGVGFMGMMHCYGVWGKHASPGRRVQGAEVVAVSTRSPVKRAGDWTAVQGNYGPRGEQEDLSGIRTYAALDALIADPDVDLVDICLPNHLHRPVAVQALEAGKHVFVEKPIALTLADADAMLAAAETAGRHLMVAHVLPLRPPYAWVLKATASGAYGKLLGGHFKRMIRRAAAPTPERLAQTGGWGIDLHIHDAHFIRTLFGAPRRVFARGVLVGGQYLDYVSVQYVFDDPALTVSCQGGAISTSARPFYYGFEIYFEKAVVAFAPDAVPLTVYHDDGRTERIALPETTPVDGFVDEIQLAVRAIAEGRDPGPLSARCARDALALCIHEAESVKRGEPVEVA